jgi:hypothetical protein
VRDNDPEQMSCHVEYSKKAYFHEAYLKAMLKERGEKTYTKTHPGIVATQEYFTALRDRYKKTKHLSSLGKLLTIWDTIN